MSIQEFEVKTFGELHEAIQKIQDIYGKHKKNTVYRGQKSLAYKLLPKVGRIEKFTFIRLKIGQKQVSSLKDQEKNILKTFKNRALPQLPRVPANDWEWLAIGQHYGLATRLLDWSKSPLVAAYFAVEQEFDEDSAIYAFNQGYFDYSNSEPFNVKGVRRITPAFYTRRIEAQSGAFTIHENSSKPIDEIVSLKKLNKIIIVKGFRARLKEILSSYGIHRASMFPDLDGISFYVNDYLVKKWIDY